MYRTIYAYLLSVPIGSHIHFSGGDRCGILRGASRLAVLLKAFSVPTELGGRGLSVWVHRLKKSNETWRSLVPIHPWNGTASDLTLWGIYEHLQLWSVTAGEIWDDLGPAIESDLTVPATNITYLQLEHARSCVFQSESISVVRNHINLHLPTCV